MKFPNPLSEVARQDDAEDLERVRLARQGSREALEALIERHQAWIYNIVRRMTFNPADAEDATQEILIKLTTRLASFEHRSRFRTRLYRIVVNHVLNMKRERSDWLASWHAGFPLGALRLSTRCRRCESSKYKASEPLTHREILSP